MKRKIFMAGILAVILLVTGCVGGRDNGEELVEKVIKVPVEVDVLEKAKIIEEFYSLGSVEPGRTYNLTAMANADVKHVFVSVGDIVKEEDLMFELERSDFQTNRTSQVSGLKMQLDNAKIQMDSAERSYIDKKICYANGTASKSALNQAEDAYESARISYRNAQTSYQTTLTSLSSTEENYFAVSPIDGVVTSRSIEEGQFASSQDGIIVAEYDPVKVAITIPSAYMDETFVGQSVRIEFPTKELELHAKVTALSLSGKAGGYPAEIELSNKDVMFLPGMVAEVYLETDREESAYVVKKNVVLDDEFGNYVFVVREGMAVRMDVETGLANGDNLEIIGDFSEGDLIVVKGQQYLDNEDLVLVK